MAVTLLCPNLKCRMVLSVPEDTRGKKVRCKYCEMTFVVPGKQRTSKSPSSEKTVRSS